MNNDLNEILAYASHSSIEPNTKLARIISICEKAHERDSLVNETPKVSTTGAVRSKLLAEGFRFDLLDSNDSAMRRLAAVFALGFKKYGADNWKRGFPNSEYYAHAREHMLAYASHKKCCEGDPEDDIAHACWNLMAIMWNEEHLPEMCDFPVQQKG